MKGMYSVAVLFVTTLAVSTFGQSPQVKIPTKCPEVDPKNTTIHLAHKDCTKFYKCFMGNPIEMDCPFMNKEHTKRLHFNPELQVCDWPYRAGCIHKGDVTTTEPTTTTTTTTSTDSIITITLTPNTPPTTQKTPGIWDCCPKDTGGEMIRVPHETKCDHYYLCIDGEKSLQVCPRGSLFNPKISYCDLPDNVDCNSHDCDVTFTPPTEPPTEPPTKPPTKPPHPPKECPPKGSGWTAKLPHECQCGKYYECRDGDAILRNCPPGTQYDWIRQVCDLPSIVKCIRPIPTFTETFPSTTVSYYQCSSKEEGMKYEDPNSCNAYYECANKQKVLKYCPQGLHFNSTLQMCEYPKKECMISSTTYSPTRTTESTEKGTCPKNSKEKFPHECSCTDYYECVNGLQINRKCPPGKQYDRIRQICDDSKVVKCDEEPTSPSTEPTTPAINDGECPARDDENRIIRFPHKTSCIFYYQCANGKKVLKSCRGGLVFNPVLRACDFPENVKKCSFVSTLPVVPNACLFEDFLEERTLPHEYDCTKYYVCRNGEEILQECPAGLEYDYKHAVCDKPEIAKCAKLIPAPTSGSIALPGSSTCAGKEDGERVPHEYNCQLYYSCTGGRRILQKCREGQSFNPLIGVCDLESNVDCKTTTPGPSVCPDEGITRVPHETNCKLYYECDNGDKTLQQCPRNNNFNPILKICDLPDNYPCDGDIVNARTTAEYKPSDCIGDCPWEDPSNYTVMLPHMDCHKFCMCSNGSPYEQNCPENLRYDYIREVCDFPAKVKCKVPPQRAFKIGSNEYQNMGKKNDWFNYVKED